MFKELSQLGRRATCDRTGESVRIEGYEEWTFGAGGLIAESKGHYDEAITRQLQSGAPPAR